MSWVADNHDWLHDYVIQLRDALNLSHWRINISSVDPEESYAGQVQIPYGRHVATIRLTLPASPEELRETLTHELLHCHFERVAWAVNNFEQVVGSSAWGVGLGAYKDAEEVTIDALTSIIAPTMPLPTNEIVVAGNTNE